MIKRTLSEDNESDSDSASFYSLDTHSSDATFSSPNRSPLGSFRSIDSKEYNSLENFRYFNEVAATKKEIKKKKLELEAPVQITGLRSPKPPSQLLSLSVSIKKQILGVAIMSSDSGAVKKESVPPKEKEPEKKKKGLKLSFKKKKSLKHASKEDGTSGPDSDFSGSSNPATPQGTLDRKASPYWKSSSPTTNKDYEANASSGTDGAGLSDKETASKESAQKTPKEKSEKRFGSFKLSKDKKKTESSPTSPPARPISPLANDPIPVKSETVVNKKATFETAAAEATNSSLKQETQPQSQKKDARVTDSAVKETGKTGPDPKSTYVSTLQVNSTEKSVPINSEIVKKNQTEVQFGQAESKQKPKNEAKAMMKTFKPFQFNKDKETKKEEKSIAQEIEEAEITLNLANNLPSREQTKQPPSKEAASSADKREHLYKILVIGELGTGKTSIIKRYVHQFFCQHYRATIGVDFALKVLNWDDNTVIRLQLWDIAGQERFGNMTRVYYKQAVGAFIVFDVTNAKTFDAVAKWKTDLDTKVTLPDGSCIPAVLLANKCDQPKEGVVGNPSRMDDFCRERNFSGWFETSAKENINIDEATKFLISKILTNEKQGLMVTESSDGGKFSIDSETEAEQAKGASAKCSC